MQPLWGGCDREAAYEMVHYGWACAASWQMLRHASETGGGNLLEEVEDAGMRRLLLLPLLLTRHRVTQGANPVMLWRKKKKKRKTDAFAAIWHLRCVPSGCLSTEHPRLKGWIRAAAGVWCAAFCANRLRINLQPTPLALFHCAKRGARRKTSAPGSFESKLTTLHRRKPEHGHQTTMPPPPIIIIIIIVVPSRSPSATILCVSFGYASDPLPFHNFLDINPTFSSHEAVEMTYRRRLSIYRPRFFYDRAARMF